MKIDLGSLRVKASPIATYLMSQANCVQLGRNILAGHEGVCDNPFSRIILA
jgi:hypothetical protein